MRYHYLNFVVLVSRATVELQLGVREITRVFLANPGDEGEVLHVLKAERPREHEVDEAVVLEGEAEVVEVAIDKRVSLDGGGFDDVVENDQVAGILQDAGGDQLGAVMAAVSFTNLEGKRPEKTRKDF